ncbi:MULTISPECIES: sensor histidine kinase [Catenuloplanes]|uniref:Signal transduction histidine-protein kinase/phosphatase MprB n=1 Tax=Catenuloplanes niger TaxID=587534 RepID=A0AAE3ZTC4_9ACTN|nr:HAMP domain-containing sensor histidine kinase [Catenuloplanes niger]MDR7325729.1 signal transduction histidine kinase [Catenuloplanes niger]
MTAVAALVFVIPLAIQVREDARERALTEAGRRSAIVAGALAAQADEAGVQRAIEAAGSGPLTDTPVVLGLSNESATGRASDADLERTVDGGRPLVVDVAGGALRLEPVIVGESTAVVEVFVPDHALNDGVPAIWWTLALIALGLVGASVFVVDRLAGRTVGSAKSLVRAAMAVGDGDLGVRIQPTGPRELAEAGYAFNRMADRLVTSRTNEREMVADLSHRLRTPLTVLRLDAEALDPDDTSVGDFSAAELDRRRTIRRIRQAIVTLEGEVDALITTTRRAVADRGAPPPEDGGCDASEVVRERMTFWSALAGDQNRPYRVLGAQTRIPVQVPRSELAAALDAVLGNVFRYTAQGTAFEIGVSRRDGWIAIRVDDAGTGIPDPERALQRGASDRGSTGLGLDIAKRATLATGGSVSIARSSLGGASVVLLFGDAEAKPKQASRFGLVGRLAGEPGRPRWPRPRDNAE